MPLKKGGNSCTICKKSFGHHKTLEKHIIDAHITFKSKSDKSAANAKHRKGTTDSKRGNSMPSSNCRKHSGDAAHSKATKDSKHNKGTSDSKHRSSLTDTNKRKRSADAIGSKATTESKRRKVTNDSKCSKDVNDSSKSATEEFFCDICKESFADGPLLHRHLRLHSTAKGFNPSALECRSKSVLIEREASVNNGPVLKDEFLCGICGLKFDSCELLQTHLTSKSGCQSNKSMTRLGNEESFICGICKMDFVSMKPLEDHITSVHQDQFQCGECSSMFLSASDLEQHVISGMCTTRDEFLCGECRGAFETMGQLEQHIISKMCNPNHIFVCGVCKSSFSCGESLQAHMFSH